MTYDPHKSTTEIRQGSRRKMNLRVLILSGLAIIIAFALIYWFYALQTPPTAV